MAEDDNKSGMKDYAKAESMIQIALVLPIACALGWLLGAALDIHFHAAWMGVTGIILGAVGGFIQTIRMATGAMKANR